MLLPIDYSGSRQNVNLKIGSLFLVLTAYNVIEGDNAMLTRREEKKLREEVASLSSGRYYDEISHWFDLLDQVVQNFSDGCLTLGCDCPQVHNDSGSSMIRIGDSELFVWWSWYRMPSYRWEIVCYLT
jgi:hypothetical protein